MRPKFVHSISFRIRYWVIRPGVSDTLTPSATSTTLTAIGTVSRPSYITTRAAEGWEGRSMCLWMCSRKKFSSMNWESMPSQSSGKNAKVKTLLWFEIALRAKKGKPSYHLHLKITYTLILENHLHLNFCSN